MYDAEHYRDRKPASERPVRSACKDLGTVNANTTRTFLFGAQEVDGLLRANPERRVQIYLRLSCQASTLYYPSGRAVTLHPDIENGAGLQSIAHTVRRADSVFYHADVVDSYTR